MRITSVEILQGKAKRQRIRLDNGADFVLYPKEARRLGLEEGEELSEEAYQDIVEEILCPRAKQRALHLLEKQDRTEKNLRQKLKEGGYPEAVIDIAVSYVASYHYIDDQRYAENYVYFHKEQKSRQRIRQDLLAKGVASEVIDRAIEEGYETDERSLIEAHLMKKHYDPKTADRKEKAKMFRFLLGRGFSMDDISDALRER